MKADVLAAVAERGEADAVEVADALGLTYEAAAMALLRAYRGGLLARIGALGLQAFRYSLTDKGTQRLEYFDGTGRDAARPTSTLNSRSGDPDMRTKRLYSGLYHCPECVYEVTLTSEPSLKCPDCGGRLYEGKLPEEAEEDYDEDDE
jgi:DNA-directed RNA polymerase subunit RPC12/RpoP